MNYPPSKLITRKLRISVHFATAAYDLKAGGQSERGTLDESGGPYGKRGKPSVRRFVIAGICSAHEEQVPLQGGEAFVRVAASPQGRSQG